MNTRSRHKQSGHRMVAIIATVLVHALIIGALFFNFKSEPKKSIEAEYAEKVDVVKATTVDAADIKKEMDKIKKKDLEKKRQQELEKKRLKELQKQSQLEKKKIDELKLEREEEKVLAEKQRKEIALKRKKEEEKRKKDEAKRKKAEAKKKKAQAERKKQEKLEAQKAADEAQRLLQEQIAAEETFQAEKKAKQRAATLSGKYAGLIKTKVNKYWAVLPGLPSNLTAKVNVKLSSSGDVKSATIVESSGYAQFDRQVISAVLKATPLPIPPKEEDDLVNKEFQDLDLNFP